MRNVLRVLLMGLVAAALPTATVAQQPRVVTFREALGMALDRSTQLRRARAELDVQNAIEARERFDFLPTLSLSTRGSRSFGRSFSQEEGEILSETNDIFDVGVSASVNLFDGFEKFASLEAASLEENASRRRLARTEQDVLFQVLQGFTTLVLDRDLAAVRADELAAADDLLARVRRLVDVGRQPLSDLYQQEAARAEAEVALVEARRQVTLSETTLMQLLQLDPLRDYEFRADAIAPRDSTEPAPEYRIADLIETALERRPDVAAAELAVDASAQGVRAARSGWWPSLDLSVNYGSNWSRNSRQAVPGTGADPRMVTVMPAGGGDPVTLPVPGTAIDPVFTQPSFLDQLDGRRGGSLSLSFSVPVFDGLQTHASVEQAEAARLNARYDLQDQVQLVSLQVRQAVLDHRAAVAQQDAAQRRLVAAERSWEAASRRYELGAATFVEVAQARAVLAAARAAAVSARYNVVLAERLIAYHTGSLDADPRSATGQEEGPS